MFDQFISVVWRLFEIKPSLARTRFRRSAPVVVESLEVRRMLTSPAITAPIAVSFNGAGSLSFTGVNAIGFTDGAGIESFSLAVQHGQLNFASTTGLTVQGNGGASILLSGTATAINAAFATLTYTPYSNYGGPDTLGMYVQNSTSGLTTNAAISMTIAPALTITAPTTIDLNQATSLSFTGSNAISINDVDAGTENVSFVVHSGTLHFGSTTGLTIYGNGSTVVTLSGTATAVNSALATLTYTAVSDASSDYLTMYVQNSATNHAIDKGITLNNIQSTIPPSISTFGTTHTSQNSTITLSDGTNGIHVYGGDTEKVTVSVSHGTLVAAAMPNVTIQNNNTGSLTLIGAPNDINAALNYLAYVPATNYTGVDSLNVAATDLSGNLTSNATAAIIVTPPITAPTIVAPTAVSANHGTFSFSGSNLISYFDSGTGTENVSFAVQHGVLNFGSTSATVSGNHSRTVLLTGTAQQIFDALLTLSYTPDNGYSGSDSLGIYAANSTNQSTSARVSIAVAPSNLSPSLITPLSYFLPDTQSSIPLTGNNAIVFSDGPGTENFSLAVQHGTLNFGSTTGLTVNGNGTSVITLSGTAAAISAALATLSYTPNNSLGDSLSIYVSNTSTHLSTSASNSMGVPVMHGGPPRFQAANGDGLQVNHG